MAKRIRVSFLLCLICALSPLHAHAAAAAADRVVPVLGDADVESAAEAFDAFAEGLGKHHPIVVWDALPASHQQDVTGLIGRCASALPPRTWHQAFEAIEQLGMVLSTKPELVRASPIALSLLAMSSEDRSSDPWFEIAPILVQIGRSPLGDTQALAALDVAKLMENEGSAISAALPDLSAATRGSLDKLIATQDRFAHTTATPVRAEDARVLLRLESPGAAAKETWFVRIEGKWVPEKQHLKWKQRLAELTARCAAPPSTNKLAGWLSALASAEPGLQQLALAETQAGFNAGMVSVAEAVGPKLAEMLLEKLLGSASIGGVQLNIGSILLSAPRSDSGASAVASSQEP